MGFLPPNYNSHILSVTSNNCTLLTFFLEYNLDMKVNNIVILVIKNSFGKNIDFLNTSIIRIIFLREG